jgi:mono/diheme cytochrome c family protein
LKPIVKKILLGVGGVVGLVAVGGAAFVAYEVHAFNASLQKVYDVPVPSMVRSSDPAVLERGRHVAEAIAPCANSDCHGTDLGGGKVIELGPLGKFGAPNISAGGLGAVYSDGELLRVIRHGVKKDGTSVRFMPSHEFNWLPEADFAAAVSWLRTQPAVQKPNGPMELGVLAKVLDRLDVLPLDVARRIDHGHIQTAPPPTPTSAYGAFISRSCTGCHGETLAGGPIPGAPPEMAVPLNLTPDATGLQGWSLDDFKKTLQTGINKKGKKLDEMMPISAFGKLDELEMQALFAYLSSLPPRPFGGR